jgi:hypothetical protein
MATQCEGVHCTHLHGGRLQCLCSECCLHDGELTYAFCKTPGISDKTSDYKVLGTVPHFSYLQE